MGGRTGEIGRYYRRGRRRTPCEWRPGCWSSLSWPGDQARGGYKEAISRGRQGGRADEDAAPRGEMLVRMLRGRWNEKGAGEGLNGKMAPEI